MRHIVQSKALKRVLVLLGWSSAEISKEIGRFAREAGWCIDARTFYTSEVPGAWRGDGLIATLGERADLNRFILRHATRQPSIILGGNKGGLAVPSVHIDNGAVGCVAARHFLDRNHRNFAWYGAYRGDVTEQRRNGFAQTIRAAGFHCELLCYRSGGAYVNWIRRRQWLESRLQSLPRPLAVFALDDILASEVAEVCHERGWEVPGEISVLGTGNLDVACECSRIPISSVDTREAEVAWKAAEALDLLMKGHRITEDAVLSPGPIVVRASTDTVAALHPSVRAAIRFMKENLSKPFGADEIARAANISRRALFALFSSELNSTPTSLLTTFRLERAKSMLLDTDEKVAAVAILCGFGTPRTFDRVFIKVQGVTPAAWRTSVLRPDRKPHKFLPKKISADNE